MALWLIAMKGLAGSVKSTLARALSRELGWPLIGKDDVKDLLVGHLPMKSCSTSLDASCCKVSM